MHARSAQRIGVWEDFVVQSRASGSIRQGILAIGLALLALAGIVAAATSDPSAPQVRPLAGNTPPLLSQAVDLGHADPTSVLEITLQLDLRSKADLQQLLRDQQDPASPRYHQWLTHEAFVSLYAPAPADLASAREWLTAQGFTGASVISSSMLAGSAPVSLVEKAFGVTIDLYSYQGRVAFSNKADPSLPASLASVIRVGGLDDITQLHPMFKSGSTNYQTGRDSEVTYDEKANYFDQGSRGTSGATVAVASEGDIKLTDLNSQLTAQGGASAGYANFSTATSGAHTTNSTCVPNTGTHSSSSGCNFLTSTSSGSVETDWDAQLVASVANDAHVEVFLSEDTSLTHFTVMYQAIADRSNTIHVITHSWGLCLTSTPSSSVTSDENIFSQAAAGGQAWFISSGDSGSNDCGTGQDSVDYPAGSQYVTGAGGSNMANSNWGSDGFRTGYTSENGCSSGGGGKANTGATIARPSWQWGPGTPSNASAPYRLVPDISMHYGQCSVSSTNLYYLVFNGAGSGVSGTSGDAPQWAGFWAVADQVTGRNLGQAAPLLFRILRNENGTSYANDFHDITSGSNGGYSAAANYDMVTGIGTPKFSNLFPDLSQIFVPASFPPLTTASLAGTSGNNGWYRSAVTVTLTCAPGNANTTCASTSYKIDGGATQTYAAPFSVSGDSASHSVDFWSTGSDSLVETTKTQTFKIDITPPTLALSSRLPAANANGWNNANVVVTWTCSDATSGPASASTSATVTSEGASQSASGTCADLAGNSASASQGGISIDKTAPSVSASRAPAANADGWNNGSVTASWACTDALSGVSTVSADQVLSSEGAAQSSTGSCTDLAGNSASASVSGVNIDLTPPAISGAKSPAANANGWENVDTTVSWTCVDVLSGVKMNGAPVTISTDGLNQPADGTCTDLAGNSASAELLVSVDKTAPTVAVASRSPLANANGWNNANVSVVFSCSDTLSGAATTPAGVTFSNDGAGQSASSSCTDYAGNTGSGSVSGVNIDRAAPSIALASRTPAANANGWNNVSVTLTWSCSDALSGATASSVSVLKSNQGAGQSATGACTDLAGNSASDTQTGVNIDKANPTISFVSKTPAPNGNGWNNVDVTATWNCADALSGPVSASVSNHTTTEGSALTLVGTCTDLAGNSASLSQTGIKVDKTSPVLAAPTLSPAANANGWNTGNVTITWACSDALSGTTTTTIVRVVSGEGASIPTSITCSDRAGNGANDTKLVSIDRTLPTIAFSSLSPAANAHGWNNADVTATWTCADAVSGPSAPSVSKLVTGSGAGLTASATCTDLANWSASATKGGINIDRLAPTSNVTLAGTLGNAGWYRGAVTVALAGSDALSGLASLSDSVDNGATQAYAGAFAVAGDGTHTVRSFATDNADNAEAPHTTSLAIDSTPPTLAAHADVFANATGPSGASVTYSLPGATDATSGVSSVACAPASGSTFAVGTTNVTCTAFDVAGNSATSRFAVHVVDSGAPIIDPHADIIAEATAPSGAVVSYSSPATHDDLDPPGVASCAPVSGSTFALGATTITCTATDSSGNQATPTTFLVTVRDTTAPVITSHADLTAEATSASGAVVSYAAPSTSDAVDGAGVASCAPASGSTFALGATTVVCSATDAHGNAAVPTSFTVSVRDTTPPTIAAHADLAAEATSAAGAVGSYTSPATSDIVDGAGFASCSPASGSTFALGTTSVSCAAVDAHGNAASPTSFAVIVRDTTPPTIAPHDDLVAEATGPAGAVVSYDAPATSDLVDGSGAATCSPASGSTFGLGDTLVSCAATDAHGNAAAPTSFTVSVRDTTPPAIAPHGDLFAEATGPVGSVVSYDLPATADLVDGSGVATCSPASGSTFALGVTQVSCAAADAHGNAAAPTSFTVSVRDTTPPAIAPHGDLVAEATGADGAVVAYDAPATSDLVDGASVASCAPASGSTFALGTTTITCMASDAAGNAATPTSFTIRVRDTTAPTIAAHDDISVEASSLSGAIVAFAAPATHDAVDGAGFASCAPASGSLFPLGNTTVTCRATDAAGNAALSTTFVVHVALHVNATLATENATYSQTGALIGGVRGVYHLQTGSGAPLSNASVTVRVVRQLAIVGFTDHEEFNGTTDADGNFRFDVGTTFELGGASYLMLGTVHTSGLEGGAAHGTYKVTVP